MTGHGMEKFPYVKVREAWVTLVYIFFFFALADYEEPKLMEP